jgi:hypothetical protein
MVSLAFWQKTLKSYNVHIISVDKYCRFSTYCDKI